MKYEIEEDDVVEDDVVDEIEQTDNDNGFEDNDNDMNDEAQNYYGGYSLAVDGNESLYPICWDVVEVENESFWMWFLSLLITDLEMTNSYHFTFILDKQKRLIEVLLKLFPDSQHRKCVRHLYSNFKNVASFKGKNLKDAL
ncbi:hypothetical protein V6N13_029721 [Hibiscus sabdariffa]